MLVKRDNFKLYEIEAFRNDFEIDDITEEEIVDEIMKHLANGDDGIDEAECGNDTDSLEIYFGENKKHEIYIDFWDSRIDLLPVAYGCCLDKYARTIYEED